MTRPSKPTPTEPETTPAKRSKPMPSPEFQQARLRRDIRLLDERRSKLLRVHDAKIATIEAERKTLTEELAAVEERLGRAGL